MKRTSLENPRAEKIYIKGNPQLLDLCTKAACLYNVVLHPLRQLYFNKIEDNFEYKELICLSEKGNSYIKESDLTTYLRKMNQKNFRALPSQCSQGIVKSVFEIWFGYFESLKEFKEHPEKYEKRPGLPRYKKGDHKLFMLPFYKDSFTLKDNFIHFPKQVSLEPIKIRQNIKPQMVRLKPINKDEYKLEVIYDKPKEDWYWCKNYHIALPESKIKYFLNKKQRQDTINPDKIIFNKFKPDKNKFIACDPGLNCLFAIINNFDGKFVILNGKPLKSVNQYFNKKIALYRSFYDKTMDSVNTKSNTDNLTEKGYKKGNKGISKRHRAVNSKREKTIDYYIHKIAAWFRAYCVKYNIGSVIFGKNDRWKQNINLGKVNNQQFVCLPLARLINTITYILEEIGIEVIVTEESYTSKIDHLALEPLKKQDNYLGRRVREISCFKSSTGIILHDDINGALGIARKVKGDSFLKKLLANSGILWLVPSKLNLLVQNYLDKV